MNSFTESEKYIFKYFKRVVVFGKGSKSASILLTNKMPKYMGIFLKVGRTMDWVPQSLKYIFVYPGSNRWISVAAVLRKGNITVV